MSIDPGQSPEVRDARIAGNRGSGALVSAGSSLTLTGCILSDNGGQGVGCAGTAAISRSTLARNAAGGLWSSPGSSVKVDRSIVWGNGGPAITFSEDAQGVVTHSCVEGGWPGEGITDRDPLFCGWQEPREAAAGTVEELALAMAPLEYRYALGPGSPCLTAGPGSSPIGAETGACVAAERVPRRVVRLEPGTYLLEETFFPDVEVAGAGVSETTIELPGGEDLRPRLTLKGAILSGLRLDGPVGATGRTRSEVRGCLLLGGVDGVEVSANAALALEGSTVAAGSGHGLALAAGAAAEVTGSILWRNRLGGIRAEGGASVSVQRSCVQDPDPWPGEGNLNADPRFCGWRGPAEVAVDRVEDLEAALAARDYNYALAGDSPCLVTGPGGGRMGAETGACAAGERVPQRVVRLAPGKYSVRLDAIGDFALVGAGRSETVFVPEGAFRDLLGEAALADLTIVGWSGYSLRLRGPSNSIQRVTLRSTEVHCEPGSSPRLSDCLIRDAYGPGLRASGRRRRSSSCAGRCGAGPRGCP